ncbi:hypothetical protein BDN72DRAFT_780570, partial [Pluteus cervinus]
MTLPSEILAGIDLKKELRGRYKEDSFFKKIVDSPRDFKNFTVEDGLVYLNDSEGKRLGVPNVLIGKRSVREIAISEAHTILAHLGSRKTLSYLRDHLWWK